MDKENLASAGDVRPIAECVAKGGDWPATSKLPIPVWISGSALAHALFLAFCSPAPANSGLSYQDETSEATTWEAALSVHLPQNPNSMKPLEPLRINSVVTPAKVAKGVLPIVAFDFIEAKDLSERPHPVGEVLPSFPDVSDATDGTVRLVLLISETGLVEKVILDEADVPDTYQQSAINAFEHARFSPGKLAGVPTKSKLLIEVAFDSGRHHSLN
jgi:hypothetical protein